jgi:hypothetical protein
MNYYILFKMIYDYGDVNYDKFALFYNYTLSIINYKTKGYVNIFTWNYIKGNTITDLNKLNRDLKEEIGFSDHNFNQVLLDKYLKLEKSGIKTNPVKFNKQIKIYLEQENIVYYINNLDDCAYVSKNWNIFGNADAFVNSGISNDVFDKFSILHFTDILESASNDIKSDIEDKQVLLEEKKTKAARLELNHVTYIY